MRRKSWTRSSDYHVRPPATTPPKKVNTKFAEPAVEEALERAFHALLFEVSRSIRYHQYMERHYDRFHFLASAFSVIFGSAAVGTSIANLPTAFVVVPTALIAVFGALDIIMATPKKARLHADLRRAFKELRRDMVSLDRPTARQLSMFRQRRESIELEEPPHLRVLNAICWNEEAEAQDSDPKEFYLITPLQRHLAPFMDVQAHKLRSSIENEEPQGRF